MSRFIDEANRSQATLLPKTIDEYVSEENPVRVIDAFVCALDVASLGFERAEPKTTGRPGYDPQHDASVIGIPFSNENRGASPQGFPAVPVYGYSETHSAWVIGKSEYPYTGTEGTLSGPALNPRIGRSWMPARLAILWTDALRVLSFAIACIRWRNGFRSPARCSGENIK